MILGLDMDGVVADFISSALKNVKDIWGLDISYKEINDGKFAENVLWPKLSEEQKSLYGTPKQIYSTLCPKGFFEELAPLPRAIEAVEMLGADHKIIFITKPLEWVNCPTEKRNWLKKHFSNVDYNVIFVNNMEDKKFIAVDAMVDDDPRVIDSLTSAIPVIIKQPWNEEYRKDTGALVLNSLREAVPYLRQLDNTLRSPYLF